MLGFILGLAVGIPVGHFAWVQLVKGYTAVAAWVISKVH